MQNEIDLQRTVSQDFSQTRAQVIGSIDRRLDRLKEQRDSGRLSESDYQTQSRQWQQGKVLLNMLAAGLASPADNAGGIAAATASPALSYQIGQYFKANDLKNQADGGQRPGESSPAHLLAHSILGAAVAASGGHNALSGALSAGRAEAAAPVLSRWLYGKAASDLMAEEKQTVADISGLLGAGIGAAAGNSSADAVSGSLSAQSAVKNNSQLFDDLRDWTKEKAETAATAARELFPDTPALSGFFLGLGDVVNGGLGLTDATAESLAMAIHIRILGK